MVDAISFKRKGRIFSLTLLAFILLIIGLVAFFALSDKKDRLVYQLRAYQDRDVLRVEGEATALSSLGGVRVEFLVSYDDGEDTVFLYLGDLERMQTVTVDTTFPIRAGFKIARVVGVHVEGLSIKPIGMAVCGAGMAGILLFWILYLIRMSRRSLATIGTVPDERNSAWQLVTLWPEHTVRLFSDPTAFDRIEEALEQGNELPSVDDGAYNDFLFLVGIVSIDAALSKELYAAARKLIVERLYERMGEERAAAFRKANVRKKLELYASLPFSGEEQWKGACFYAVYDAFAGTNAARYAQFLDRLGGRNAR